MGFINSTDRRLKWRYKISEIQLLYANGKIETIQNDRVTYLYFLHDYDTNLYPIFRIKVVLEKSVYFRIIKNKDTIKFKIRLQKYNKDLNGEHESLKYDVINQFYDLILDDEQYNTDDKIQMEEDKLDYKYRVKDEREDPFKADNEIEFFLFNRSMIQKLNTDLNFIIQNATVSQAIETIFSNIGLKNLLMSISENRTIYPELVIPPLSAKQALMWLDSYYGLYQNGSVRYADFINNIVYILKYSASATAWERNEIKYTDIMIPSKSGNAIYEPCSLYRSENKEHNMVIANNTSVILRDESVSFDAINALNIRTIDSDSGVINENMENNGSHTKILQNHTENIWYGDMYSNIIGKKKAFDVTLHDYDISIIAPNKEFKLLFENVELGKKYNFPFRISSVSHTFMKDGNDFRLVSLLNFRTTNK